MTHLRTRLLVALVAVVLLGVAGQVQAVDQSQPAPGTPAEITVCGMHVPSFLLKHPYAWRLIFAKGDRACTQAAVLDDGRIRLGNIYHEKELWSATVDPAKIAYADVINQPIAPGVFHFGALFGFGPAGLTLEMRDGRTTTIHELVMGTGPEKAFSLDGTIGFQLLQMRASSVEAFQGPKPLEAKVRNRLDPRRVDIALFFLAEVEEAARLAALTAIRAFRAEYPDKSDRPEVQKYHFLGANCVSSGIQNLTRAVRPELRNAALALAKRDVKSIMDWTPDLARRWIRSWNEVTFLAFDGLRGQSIDSKRLTTVSEFHKNLRSSNQMSLPWRAKTLIDWAAGR